MNFDSSSPLTPDLENVETPGAGPTGIQRSTAYSEVGDAAAGIGTAYTISVGDTFNGNVSTGTDSDWIAINLTAGESYVFQLWGRGGQIAGLDDTVLTLRDSTGAVLSTNDDAFPGRNTFSLIEFTATTTGTYYLEVQSYGTEAGLYTLQATTDVFTPQQVADYISLFDWGIPVPISFNVAPGGSLSVNISALTSDGQQLALWALETWGTALGITFNTTTSTGADIVFDDNQAGAFAGPSSYNPVTGVINQSTVNISTSWLATHGTTIDSYSFQTYLHEIGHALGLSHAGPYNGTATYGDDNVYQNDSTQITIMSYFGANENPTVTGDFANIITPMISDLIAVHDQYGTPQAYTGNTTWGANSNIGGWLGTVFGHIFDGVTAPTSVYQGGPIALTIFDTGGTDTLDLSTQTVAQRVDIRQGAISDIGGIAGNAVIAMGTIIENVIGGSGNDTITGNEANNQITGGAGNDSINGGAGSDTAVLAVARNTVTVTENAGIITIVSALGTDQYTGIEFFSFTDGLVSVAELINGGGVATEGPDNLLGTPGNDVINALGGNDTVNGAAGNDTLYGANGNDLLIGGLGADTMHGQGDIDTVSYAGASTYVGVRLEGGNTWGAAAGDAIFTVENVIGSDFGDYISGYWAANVLEGGAGNDTLLGEGGHDTLIGGLGADEMHGQSGIDTVSYAGASTYVGVRLEGGNTWGAAAGDVINTVENVIGSDFGDYISGYWAANTLEGGAGNDTLLGLGGHDTLIGGLGADEMHGQSGVDTVSYAGASTYVGVRLEGGNTWGAAAGDVINTVENVIGSGFGDYISGYWAANTLEGGAGNDTLLGEGGHDTLIGGLGADEMHGQSGIDTVSYAGASTYVGVRLEGGNTWGAAAGDVINTVENVIGSGFGDYIYGYWAANTLEGGAGNDTLYGVGGHDTLIGGAGNDSMYGQTGNDTFVFADNFGQDVIGDFEAWNSAEKIDLSGLSTIASYAALTGNGHMSQVGANVVINDLAGNTITLLNVTLGHLDATDFIF